MAATELTAFSLEQLYFALPVLTVVAGIVVVMLLAGWRRSNSISYYATLSVLLLAILLSLSFFPEEAVSLTMLAKLNKVTSTIFIMLCVTSLMIVYIARQYLLYHVETHEEFYILFLLVVLGASTLIFANHFASLFLGFELMSIALVGLVGYLKQQSFSIEASFKYLILSATASSFMLLGIAFLYAYTGTLSFDGTMPTQLEHGNLALSPLLLSLGCLLFFSGLAFKVSLVPFHYWTPDVYVGAPTPVTLMLATISKLAIFTALLKCCFSPLFSEYFLQPQMYSTFAGLALLSMIIGNALALKQKEVKRILAYSSIAHMGYLMVLVFVASNNSISLAWQTTIFYFVAYILATVSMFYLLCHCEQNSGADGVNSAEFSGLFWRSPKDAVLMMLSLLSLAGIPLTAGFIGKFYLISFASYHALWLLLGAIILGSAISLAYYLPLIFKLFEKAEVETEIKSVNLTSVTLVYSLIIATLYLGVLPGRFTSFLAWL